MITSEQPAHHELVEQLTEAAFAASEFGHHGESAMIASLRQEGGRVISVVAFDGEQLIGHAIASPIVIDSENEVTNGLAIGPMAVRPSSQRRGVGSQLVNAVIERAEAAGEPILAVAGHPGFYTRFGFQPSLDFGVQHCFEGMPDEVFFLRRLQMSVPDHFVNGRLVYPSAFGRQDRFA